MFISQYKTIQCGGQKREEKVYSGKDKKLFPQFDLLWRKRIGINNPNQKIKNTCKDKDNKRKNNSK